MRYGTFFSLELTFTKTAHVRNDLKLDNQLHRLTKSAFFVLEISREVVGGLSTWTHRTQ
jgi:hypothetical protein